MILGIDTSAGRCGVALVAGGSIVTAASEPMDRGHAERLFPLIEAAFAEAGVGIDGVSRVAVCTGPGSFTGLRVGVAAARGLALGRGIPAIGITRFEAIATAIARPARTVGDRAEAGMGAVDLPGAPGRTVPRAVDEKVGWAESRPIAVALAGRGSVFLQRFGPDLAALSEPALITPQALAAAIDPRDVKAGDGWGLAGLAPDLAPEGLADPALAAAMAADRPADTLPVPLYLRGADADLPREAPPVLLD